VAKEKVGADKSVLNKPETDKMKVVKDLIDKGKKNGTLSYKEIMDTLEDI
jgi:RNA polymerase primary sigma factor